MIFKYIVISGMIVLKAFERSALNEATMKIPKLIPSVRGIFFLNPTLDEFVNELKLFGPGVIPAVNIIVPYAIMFSILPLRRIIIFELSNIKYT